jgi:hypothetical protein
VIPHDWISDRAIYRRKLRQKFAKPGENPANFEFMLSEFRQDAHGKWSVTARFG